MSLGIHHRTSRHRGAGASRATCQCASRPPFSPVPRLRSALQPTERERETRARERERQEAPLALGPPHRPIQWSMLGGVIKWASIVVPRPVVVPQPARARQARRLRRQKDLGVSPSGWVDDGVSTVNTPYAYPWDQPISPRYCLRQGPMENPVVGYSRNPLEVPYDVFVKGVYACLT